MPTTITNEYLRKEFNNFELNEDLGNLIEELKYSTLIVPIDNENEGCIMVSMNDEEYIPIFTDIHEYQKVNFNESVHPEAFDFNFYLEILKAGALGFIVNIEFSSKDKINPPHRNINFYTQLVNLPLFIDFILKKDLAGIKLNDEIVISRDFLLEFMKDFSTPNVDNYDDYLFTI